MDDTYICLHLSISVTNLTLTCIGAPSFYSGRNTSGSDLKKIPVHLLLACSVFHHCLVFIEFKSNCQDKQLGPKLIVSYLLCVFNVCT